MGYSASVPRGLHCLQNLGIAFDEILCEDLRTLFKSYNVRVGGGGGGGLGRAREGFYESVS